MGPRAGRSAVAKTKNPFPCREPNCLRPFRSLVFIQTELSTVTEIISQN